MSKKLLIVDDDAAYARSICTSLVRKLSGFSISFAESPQSCLTCLAKESFEVIILDIQFGNNRSEGFDLVEQVKKLDPEAEVLMLSSLDDYDSIATALKLGASDFISKITGADEIVLRVRQALLKRKRRLVNDSHSKPKGAVYVSKAMEEIFAIAKKARAATNLNVLISGPTGAGKEVVAQSISRADEDIPFVAINCAAITKSLLMSELFGHEKGAFTGAMARSIGRFEAADGGDIFLDEIDSLDLEAQAALLRTLETKEVRRVGSNETKKLEFRVIAATNANIEEKISNGLFREDLFARLQGIRIQLPALAQRKEDIPVLIDYFVKQMARRKISISPPCIEILKTYEWPQNVRQLKQVLESMIALSEDEVITLQDLPSAIRDGIPKHIEEARRRPNTISMELRLGEKLDDVLNHVARKYVSATIARLGQKVSHTGIANVLGLTRSTMQRGLTELGFCQGERYQNPVLAGKISESSGKQVN